MEFSYHYVTREKPAFILPDTMLMFVTKKRLTPFLDKSDDVEEVIFPVDSQTLLVGTRAKWLDRDFGNISSLLASCSFKRFIALSHDKHYLALTSKIGKNASLIRRDELAAMYRESLGRTIGTGLRPSKVADLVSG
jgi:hypothetical protein